MSILVVALQAHDPQRVSSPFYPCIHSKALDYVLLGYSHTSSAVVNACSCVCLLFKCNGHLTWQLQLPCLTSWLGGQNRLTQ